MLQIAPRVAQIGTETAFAVLARAEALRAEGQEIINLGIGQPDFPTPDHIVAAGREALARGRHGYTPAAGIPELREAVARDRERRTGAAVDSAAVLITPGAKVTMFFATQMFGGPGAEILYPNPGFPIYESAIALSGARPVPYRLEASAGFSFDAEALLAQITPATRLIILNSPANPTGGVTPAEQIDRLAAGLESHPAVAVLSDQIYDRFVYDGREHRSLLQYEGLRSQLILLNGWSKTYAMTGWRLGYSVWPAALFPLAERLAINCYSCPNAAAQYAGVAALEGPQEAVEEMVAAFDERRQVLVTALNAIDGVECATPGGAFYAFPNIKETGLDSRTLQDRLLTEAGVATISGTSFGAYGEGFLRLSYASSLDHIRTAVERLRAFLDGSA